jgi:Ca2+-transporting ATPase
VQNKPAGHQFLKAWHALEVDELSRALHSDTERGLTSAEAAARLAQYGPNELPAAPPVSVLKLFLSQFSSLIVWVLIGAAIVSGLLQEWVDAAAIVAIVILNAILGFVQEFRAERSLEALKQMVVVTARVFRDGSLVSLPARDLVPSDLIQVEAGDRIPTDARLVYATVLRTQEASLTGESTPVAKSIDPIPQAEVPLGDRHNMLYMGTVAVSGKARALVVGTGIHTEIGKIAVMIQEAAEAEREETPLQRRLEQLGHTLLWLCLGIVAVVFLLGELRGVPVVTMFLTAVSLAVAAIPEGLPAVVTITLALGVTRMVKRHALIRRLPAVETLGSTTVICSDKTGTLTKNEMTVTALYQGGEIFTVSGEGYAPVGDILSFGEPVKPETRPGLNALLRASVLCNGAELRQEEDHWTILGDPTEGALLVAAAKAGLSKQELEQTASFLGEAPFDSERKKMTIVRRTASGPVAFVKGAPDVLLRDCRAWIDRDGRANALTDEVRQEILAANQNFASQALRVLGVATRPLDRDPEAYDAADLERDLIFVGLLAMKDPIRPEVKVAVEACRGAGIRTVMITGDHKDTAVAIARELGILEGEKQAISGAELDRLTDAALAEQVDQIAVYARVSAEHKLRVVQAWKSKGAVVAMTGDGVNDAPAVKAADIGVAMGITGTDVTKEASDVVVTDDNFASIAAAVEEGRAIYDNIVKAVHYLLSCNISEILVMLLATLLGLPLPLLPVQILWINLVTDGLPALALAVDPRDPSLMQRPPRRPEARILERERIFVMFGQGLLMTLITMLSFVYCLYSMDQDLERARTVTFMVLVGAQLAHAFNCRSDRRSLFAIGLLTNKPLLWTVGVSTVLQVGLVLNPWTREVFKLASFNPEHWLLVFAAGPLMLIAVESWKAARKDVGTYSAPGRF